MGWRIHTGLISWHGSAILSGFYYNVLLQRDGQARAF